MEKISSWTKLSRDDVMSFCDGYIDYLNTSKTERLAVKNAEEIAKKAGFKNFENMDTLKPGDKVYYKNRGKNIVLAVIGTEDITKGTSIVAAHIDSPRLDIKPSPIYEDSNLTLFKTHYYGGIKKYQWTAIPLSLIGVVVKSDGTVIEVNIGENEGDPVLTVTDLLPHLAQEQMVKKMSEAFTGEDLNLLIGSIPADSEKDKFKTTILDILKAKYDICEEDFASSELEVVPQFKAASVGLDSSMVGAYGQDDRVCAYTALKAITEIDNPQKTSICFLADKEEVGSMGNTGMQSRFFENFLAEMINKIKGEYNDLYLRRTLTSSMCLSSDVAAAVDPNYKSVSEPLNSCYFGDGISICKYTGARGKSSTSDANAEFVAKIRRIFDENNIDWQMCELGRTDLGGGGTVAQFIANLDVDTIDVGVGLLSMHAPYEISSKADVYSAYKAYKAFYNYKD
jgi:aspartyl aminopeptidase